ncbi:IS1634 family transposase, partial [Desulfosarcina sp. OttesenSCG-928-G10]|nr:IS1634 family transposase [Desulfosarcina sp. OttesenSCG-928-G10]
MHIDIIPNRNSKPTYLLRETHREGKKVVKHTLANLSKLPPNVISGLSILLAGGKALPAGEDPIVVQKTLPHGHVAAVLGIMKEVDFERLLSIANPRVRQLVIAMVASRLLDPASKLTTAGMLSPESEVNSLGRMLNLGEVNVNELYTALDVLYVHQPKIEQKLARRHLA